MPRFERNTTSRGRSGRAGDVAPHPPVAAQARFADGERAHYARFPTLRATYSPW